MNQYSQLLWYRQPSQDGFNEAMVIGNGRLGASLCGYPKKERIYLNEATFWSGGPGNNIMPGAKEHLEELRKAIFDGDFQKAQEITNRYFVCGIGDAKSGMIFQPVGELTIEMSAPADDENATNYYRYLSTENSETGCEYRVGNVQYQREGFASHPDDIIVLKYTADQPQSISFRLDFHSEHTHKAIAKDNRLYFLGKGSDAKGVKGVLSVCAVAEIRAQNGTVSALGSTLSVNGADSAEILLSIATSYKTPYDVSLNAEQKAVRSIRSTCWAVFPLFWGMERSPDCGLKTDSLSGKWNGKTAGWKGPLLPPRLANTSRCMQAIFLMNWILKSGKITCLPVEN